MPFQEFSDLGTALLLDVGAIVGQRGILMGAHRRQEARVLERGQIGPASQVDIEAVPSQGRSQLRIGLPYPPESRAVERHELAGIPSQLRDPLRGLSVAEAPLANLLPDRVGGQFLANAKEALPEIVLLSTRRWRESGRVGPQNRPDQFRRQRWRQHELGQDLSHIRRHPAPPIQRHLLWPGQPESVGQHVKTGQQPHPFRVARGFGEPLRDLTNLLVDGWRVVPPAGALIHLFRPAALRFPTAGRRLIAGCARRDIAVACTRVLGILWGLAGLYVLGILWGLAGLYVLGILWGLGSLWAANWRRSPGSKRRRCGHPSASRLSHHR